MKIDVSTLMMLAFIVSLVGGIWKIWAFMPNKELADDDTTPQAQAKIEALMLKVIADHKGKLSEKELFNAIVADESFDKKLFWRFNQNKLTHLLQSYYAKHPSLDSIASIYETLQ